MLELDLDPRRQPVRTLWAWIICLAFSTEQIDEVFLPYLFSGVLPEAAGMASGRGGPPRTSQIGDLAHARYLVGPGSQPFNQSSEGRALVGEVGIDGPQLCWLQEDLTVMQLALPQATLQTSR